MIQQESHYVSLTRNLNLLVCLYLDILFKRQVVVKIIFEPNGLTVALSVA